MQEPGQQASASNRGAFGKYHLLAKIATGGMGELFLAKLQADGGFEKLVVIKRILPHKLEKRAFCLLVKPYCGQQRDMILKKYPTHLTLLNKTKCTTL